jgi:hypothetical protein
MRLGSIAEVSEQFKLRPGLIRSLERQGIIPSCRLGRRVFIKLDDLEALIAAGGKSFPAGWRKVPGNTRSSTRQQTARVREGEDTPPSDWITRRDSMTLGLPSSVSAGEWGSAAS